MDKRGIVQCDESCHCPPNAIIWLISKNSSFWSVPSKRSGEAIVGPHDAIPPVLSIFDRYWAHSRGPRPLAVKFQ